MPDTKRMEKTPDEMQRGGCRKSIVERLWGKRRIGDKDLSERNWSEGALVEE